MRYRVIFLIEFLLLAQAAFADQVSLKNGDRITGKVQKKDGASLVVKTDLFGVITIPWDAVVELVSDDPLTVALADGKSVLGKVNVAKGQVDVTTQTGSVPVAIADVKAIRNAPEQKAYERLLHPGILSLWTGYADLGLSLARGNAETGTFNTSTKVSRETRSDKIALYFTQIYSQGKLDDGKTEVTAKAVRGGWSYNRNFSPRFFVNPFNDYEYDAFQGLDLRVVIGAGLGYQATKKEGTELNLVAGISYDRERFSTPLTRDSAEAYWGNTFVQKVSKGTTLTQSFKMFDNLNGAGQYRIGFDTGAATTLRKWLSWQLNLSDRYISNPAPGRKKNDLLLTTGFRVTFAR